MVRLLLKTESRFTNYDTISFPKIVGLIGVLLYNYNVNFNLCQ